MDMREIIEAINILEAGNRCRLDEILGLHKRIEALERKQDSYARNWPTVTVPNGSVDAGPDPIGPDADEKPVVDYLRAMYTEQPAAPPEAPAPVDIASLATPPADDAGRSAAGESIVALNALLSEVEADRDKAEAERDQLKARVAQMEETEQAQNRLAEAQQAKISSLAAQVKELEGKNAATNGAMLQVREDNEKLAAELAKYKGALSAEQPSSPAQVQRLDGCGPTTGEKP